MDRGSLTSRIVSGIARVTDNPEAARAVVTAFGARTSFSHSVAVAGETIRDFAGCVQVAGETIRDYEESASLDG